MHRFTAAVLLLAAFLTSPMLADDCPSQFGCPRCRSCEKACVLKVEQEDEEETCYEVECEEVCIPAVRFPWETCRPPRCGRVRLVARLKEESRETKVCKYDWQVVCPRCGRCAADEGKDGDAATPPLPAPSEPEAPMPPAPPAAEQALRPRAGGTRLGRASSRSFVTPAGHSVRAGSK